MQQESSSTSTKEGASLTLEVYVRSLAPRAIQSHQEEIFRRLERLEAIGIVDEYAVELWGRELPANPPDGDAIGQDIRNRIGQFRRWASAADVSLEPGFSTETVRSTITGETSTRIRVPAITLAEYVGDDLQFVSPCTDDGTAITVTDRLDAIERGVAATQSQPAFADVTAEQRQRGVANDE